MRRFGLLLIALSSAGCFTLVGPPPAGYERDELACADERDNDQDGRVDCEDSDCLMGGFCGVQIPIIPPPNQPENTFDLCSDGVDNDDNGKFDCGDTNCQSIMELCCSVEIDDASCSDRIDNDGNGFADCADFSCRNNRFVTVCEVESSCTDRIDNDGDRDTDCNDSDCATNAACLPPPEGDCTNGADDNHDGKTDCSDVSCYSNPACLGPENTLERCMDGNDNDGNSYVDCNDFGCSRSTDPAIMAHCAARGAENTLAQCSNGVDDDGNRYTDCADHGCTDTARGATAEAIAYCAERAENTLERCTDGVDNDGNRYIDCADHACSRSTDPAILAYCATVTETTFETCRDHRDNDHNGYVDCSDRGCQLIHAGWGVDVCESNADCKDGFACQGGYCIRDCSGGGTCPPGTQCLAATGQCIESCAADSECDPGETCYRSRCLALRSPCFESMWVDANQTVQSNDSNFPTDSTCGEQVSMARGSCANGRDDDGDGFSDCEDWECNYNPLVTTGDPGQVCAALATTDPSDDPPRLCRFAGGRTCVIGPRVGQACSTDADCGDFSGACSRPGAAGQTFVCP